MALREQGWHSAGRAGAGSDELLYRRMEAAICWAKEE
jgi:hypothetical protein